MDLFSILRIIRARWIVVVPILLVTLLLAGRIYTDRSTTYWLSGTQLLMAGGHQVSAADQTEVADVGAALLGDLLTQPSVRRSLTAEGLSETFTVSLTETGTTLRTTIIGDSGEQVVNTAARLVELAPDLLVESLGERAAESIVVEQAIPGEPEDAVQTADGRYQFATVLVVSPTARSRTNPFPPSLATVRSLVAVAESVPFVVDVRTQTGASEFSVSGDVREAPLVDINVWAASPEDALGAHEYIVEKLRTDLDSLQAGAGIDTDSRTQLRTLVEASVVVPTATSQMRPVAAVVILGSGLAIGLAVIIEAIAAERRRRRTVESDSVELDPAPDSVSARRRSRTRKECTSNVDVTDSMDTSEAEQPTTLDEPSLRR